MSEYIFPLTDFPNDAVDLPKLMVEIRSTAITKAIDYTDKNTTECLIYFKADLEEAELSTLSGVVQAHDGVPVKITAPTMDDGRPIVRADTRPLDTSTFFTMAGDTASGIGNGTELRWDFSDPSYTVVSGYTTLSNGFEIPEGYKAIVLDLTFLDSAYFKDGTIYHFDSPWGQYCSVDIVVPSGSYYPNDAGSIPASALGLTGTQMYSYAAVDQTFYRYVNIHYMYQSCPMGDELNAEGAMIDALPVGWFVRGVIVTPNSDNTSKGFAELEMYRRRSIILPGDSP